MTTGSLQKKSGKYYAVICFNSGEGKQTQKWISTGYTIIGNKKKAD